MLMSQQRLWTGHERRNNGIHSVGGAQRTQRIGINSRLNRDGAPAQPRDSQLVPQLLGGFLGAQLLKPWENLEFKRVNSHHKNPLGRPFDRPNTGSLELADGLQDTLKRVEHVVVACILTETRDLIVAKPVRALIGD